MGRGEKRKADGDTGGSGEKRTKTKKKQWRPPRKNDERDPAAHSKATIQPGDSGIWATCTRGKEAMCIRELLDLFTETAEHLFEADPQNGLNSSSRNGSDNGDDESVAVGIENEIAAEVAGMHRPSAAGMELFTPIRTETPCVVFFKTRNPLEPVSFVKQICEDAQSEPQRKRTRFARRLSPMTLMGKASVEGLEKVATEVLRPHFHQQDPFRGRKFAIRPNIRNHNTLTRDSVIKQVASIVGPGHEVDLNHYELLIVVEIFQSICGVSVIDDSFERLCRYNLAEIFDPTPKEASGNVNQANTGQ